MTVPFRVGVMQLTMEPLEEMLESARVMDEAGLDTIWLAEAYPWWRKHGMEAKSSTVLAGIIARETKRLTVGWGIISPYTRHPVQVAMDARLVQEAAGPGRFIAGFGTSKIFLNNTKQGGPPKVTKPLATMRDSVEILRGILRGERFEYDGKVFSADIPALSPDAHVPRWDVPVYVAGTAPLMQQLGGEIGDGLLTPSITTPEFVRYTLGNVKPYFCATCERASIGGITTDYMNAPRTIARHACAVSPRASPACGEHCDAILPIITTGFSQCAVRG